jgi:hypothetical protein
MKAINHIDTNEKFLKNIPILPKATIDLFGSQI